MSEENLQKSAKDSGQLSAAEPLSTLSLEQGVEEDVLARLEQAAEKRDEGAFLQVVRTADWQRCSPSDFLHAVSLALQAGAHLAARQISSEGAQFHPDDQELQRYARVLAPPRVISNSLPADPTQEANRAWLLANRGAHSGRWVALRNGQLLGVADSITQLIEQIGDPQGVFLTLAY